MIHKVIGLLIFRLIFDSGNWKIGKNPLSSNDVTGTELYHFEAYDIDTNNKVNFAVQAHNHESYTFFILNGSGNNVGRQNFSFNYVDDNDWDWYMKCDEAMREDVTNVWVDSPS